VARLVPAMPAPGGPITFTEDQAAQFRIANDHLMDGNVAEFQSSLRALLD